MAAPAALRNLRIILWGMVMAIGIGATWLFMPAALPQAAELGRGSYRLATTKGADFTEASLKGQPSLGFFGFTHCPDVCPMTLSAIAGWQDELGPSAEGMKVWFVTVDPARDTPEVLAEYLAWLPGAIGVTGSEEELDKARKAFGIMTDKVPLEGDNYAMDHSARVLLFDHEGRFRDHIGYLDPPEQVIVRLQDLLGLPG